jgi:hypothetical protein
VFAWLPAFVALGAVAVALIVGPGDDGATPPLRVGTESAAVPLSAQDAPESADAAPPTATDAAEVDPPPGPPPLPIALDVWPVALEDGRVDAVAVRGDRLYVAVQTVAQRPLIDPAIVRVHALDAAGAEDGRPWRAAILGPSPVALAASGGDVVAIWSHRAHPGRELATTRIGAGADAGFEVLAAEGAFTPVGQPLIAPAADDGFLACANNAAGAPRCVALDDDGSARWSEISALRRYTLWRLVPNGAGYFLFGTDCGREGWGDAEVSAVSCRTPRVVLQELDATGRPRGRLRWIARFQGNRELGVIGLGDEVMLYGRRAVAQESTALLIGRRAVKELDGRWNRTAGGLGDAGGALLLEVDKLHMEDGLPVAGYRPRRWSPGDGRVAPEGWPEGVASRLPHGLEQRLVAANEVIAVLDPPTSDGVRGVALRLHPGASGLAQAAQPAPNARP